MNCSYEDIRSRISEPPAWWDESACPRYGEFCPEQVSNIYAREAALLLVECQSCGREFRVCLSHDGLLDEAVQGRGPLCDQIRAGTIHYGDPPNVECCMPGPAMNCVDRRVIEYWRREQQTWERVPEFEVEIPQAEDVYEAWPAEPRGDRE